jgi:hypothetical protein
MWLRLSAPIPPIAGGPDWIDTEHYDIDAKADGPCTLDQMHEMFRTLLYDRFQLRFHHETRPALAYVMTVSKSGAKLKLSESQEPLDVPIKPDVVGAMAGARVPMSYLGWFLSQQLGAPVVNETGLDGYYEDPGLVALSGEAGQRRVEHWTEGILAAVRTRAAGDRVAAAQGSHRRVGNRWCGKAAAELSTAPSTRSRNLGVGKTFADRAALRIAYRGSP